MPPSGPDRTQGESRPSEIWTQESPNTNHGGHNSIAKLVAAQRYSIDRCQYDGAVTPHYRQMSVRWSSNTTLLKLSYSRLPAGQSEDRIPMAVIFPIPVQTGPGAHPAFCAMGTGLRPSSKAIGSWNWPPTLIGTKVKERLELHLCSVSGPSYELYRYSSQCLWNLIH